MTTLSPAVPARKGRRAAIATIALGISCLPAIFIAPAFVVLLGATLVATWIWHRSNAGKQGKVLVVIGLSSAAAALALMLVVTLSVAAATH